MSVTYDPPPNPLMIPELVSRVVGDVEDPIDLFHCSFVHSTWYTPAMQKLYRGSMNDMGLRTPAIDWLNSLFMASRDRFAQNVGFVEHLAIAPEMNVLNYDSNICRKKCCLLRDRNSTELLMARPREKGPTSLAIPFGLEQDITPLRDLIIHPGFKSLTIDHVHCNRVEFDPGDLVSLLSNLQALSIHRSKEEIDVKSLCYWLTHCDLKIFQIDQVRRLAPLPYQQMVQLVRHLWQHRNLEALALRLSCGASVVAETFVKLEKETGFRLWPRLRALYVNVGDHYWLWKLATFEKLQILELRAVEFVALDLHIDIAFYITCCRNLQVVDLEFDKVKDSEIFVTIASGCPLLQRFRVETLEDGPQMTRDRFSRLLHVLPRVKLLSLSVCVKMTASELRDISNCCPQLMVLELDYTRLCLSLESLSEAPCLSGLTALRLYSVWFANPSRYKNFRRLQGIATEWSRVFPRIRRIPCPQDEYRPATQKEERSSSRESHGDDDHCSTDDNNEIPPDDPGPDFDEHGSNLVRMRRRLWKLLQYETENCHETLTGTHHMWQTKLEIDILGWPVTPMKAFVDPQSHSSPKKAKALDPATFLV